MSYRSFKRVLGETSLERKCRILFGVSLLLLISVAFWYAERIAENLVTEKTRTQARDFMDMSLMEHHFQGLAADPDFFYSLLWPEEEGRDRAKLQQLFDPDMYREINAEFLKRGYDWAVLVPDRRGVMGLHDPPRARPPEGDREKRIFAWFAQQFDQAPTVGSTDVPLAAAASEAEQTPPATTDESVETSEPERLWYLQKVGNLYEYYQPVYWSERCKNCHFRNAQLPFWVIKVALPNAEIQTAINRSRALLAVTAIVTVSLAMLALYVVVRYVIVKPLEHLRDVSDEIVRGNYNVRATIQSNDEFEEVAESFNRMLRHLVDAQQELRQVNRALDAKVDELARTNMQLHEMNRLKSDFLANMSHELRTPLNSIIGFSDVLTGIAALNDKQKRYVENIRKSGRMLLDMINDTLDLAKLESGKMEVRPSEFSIGSVIAGQCDLVRSLTEEKNIDLEVRVDPDLPDMFQDRGKIQQILTNLLSNAIKFTPEGGRIIVSAGRKEVSSCLMTVADTGVGIAEEDRETIFEKFRQGSATLGKDSLTREFSGTGLGLSIVKELCRLLGGEITFESDVGKGSAFFVELPWNVPVSARRDTSLATRLDQLTKPRRREALTTNSRIGPPADGDASAEDDS